MTATDPPDPTSPEEADPDAPGDGAADAAPPQPGPPADPPPRNRGGRPGLTTDEIESALDRFVARVGRTPSQTELRRELGNRGSMTTLARARAEILAERFVAGAATPERGSAEATLFRALGAAMTVLATEAGAAADAVVGEGERVANDRVAAAEALTRRAEAAGAEAALERERALGRAETLEADVRSLREERRGVDADLAAGRTREDALRAALEALRSGLGDARGEIDRLGVGTEALERRAVEAEATLSRERDGWEDQAIRTSGELAAAADRAGELDVRVARTEGQRDAQAARGDEARAQVRQLEVARDDARARADRLDGASGVLERRARAAEAALDAARRTETDLRDHVGGLRAQLVATGVDVADIAPVPAPRAVEDQAELPFDGPGEVAGGGPGAKANSPNDKTSR